MTELERYQERDAWIPVRADIELLAKQLAGTPFVGAFRGKPAEVFGAILYGRELNLAPLQALQAMDSIDGKPTLKSEALRALFFREGHRLEVVHWDDKRCTIRAERHDGLSSVEVTYTLADAQTAGLTNKRNWRTSPKQMLHARATAMAIRAVAPDIALGIDMADDVEPAQPARTATTVVQVAPPKMATAAPQEPVETVEAELVDPEPDPTPEPSQEPSQEPEPPSEDLVTTPQMRMLGALIRRWEGGEGRTLDREERRRFIGFMAGVPDPDSLASANDLTRVQASEAITQLNAAIDAQGTPDADPGQDALPIDGEPTDA